MSKILEMIERIRQNPQGWDTIEFFEHDIETIMKEYAEFYAKECLQIAAENAESITDIDKYIYGSVVDKSSILNIDLPKHEDL